jgi:hypothetical protein
MKVKMYTMDDLEYCGSIIEENGSWHYTDVKNDHLTRMTTGMPLKAVLACLVSFQIVYDIIEE